jgi:sterol desaturase/sphingolipid hydroxylase (fatty acid hydroxylase superfamily)
VPSVVALLVHVVVFVALAAALLVPLEQLWPKVWSSSSSSSSSSSRTGWVGDIAWLTLGAATLECVIGPLLAAVPSSPWTSSSWLGLVGALLGAELGAYASHRLMHSVPWLWRFHAVHHDVAVLTWSKAWRQHPVDVAVHAIAVAIPGLLCGVSLSGFGAVLLLRRLWTGFLHANVSLRFGVLEHVVATPAFHHAHHSSDPRRFNANYAGLLPVLDRLFGTWQPLDDGVLATGTPDRLAPPAPTTTTTAPAFAGSRSLRRSETTTLCRRQQP